MIHVKYSLQQGAQAVEIITADTDVVVKCIGLYFQLKAAHKFNYIWIAFGSGKHLQYIRVSTICESLGLPLCNAPFIQLLVTTSSFKGYEKKKALDALKSLPKGFLIRFQLIRFRLLKRT